MRNDGGVFRLLHLTAIIRRAHAPLGKYTPNWYVTSYDTATESILLNRVGGEGLL